MDVRKEMIKIADDLKKSVITGKTLQQARKILSDLMRKAQTKTLYSDEYWQGPTEVMKALTANNIDWDLIRAEYSSDGKTKEWKLNIVFQNEKGVEKKIMGRITAFAAGSVSDPFSKYDLVTTAY